MFSFTANGGHIDYIHYHYSPNQWIAILASSDWPRNSEHPWIFTVLGRDSKWLLVLRQFRKMTF